MKRGNYGHSHREGSDVLPDPHREGGAISLQEIEDILLDESYAGAERREWLNTLLTRLSQRDPASLSAEERRIVSRIKEILDDYQSGEPKSDDVL